MSDMRRRARACAVGKQPFVLIDRQPPLTGLSFGCPAQTRAERLTRCMVAPIPATIRRQFGILQSGPACGDRMLSIN
jgi:hypothetical protein